MAVIFRSRTFSLILFKTSSNLRSKYLLTFEEEFQLLKTAAIAEACCYRIGAPRNHSVGYDDVFHVGSDAASFGLLASLEIFSTSQCDKAIKRQGSIIPVVLKSVSKIITGSQTGAYLDCL